MAALDIAMEVVQKLRADGRKAALISAEIATMVYVAKDDGEIVGQSIGDKSNADEVLKKIQARL